MSILVVGNWKMAPEKSIEVQKIAKTANTLARTHKKNVTIVICPPFPFLSLASKQLTIAKIGAQSVSQYTDIEHTGLVSAAMLKQIGATHVIIGHSEARAVGTTNEAVHEQLLCLLEKNITPILCVGEDMRDSQGWYLGSVKEQLETALAGVVKSALKKIVIAYEPVWSIGNDAQREASAEECAEMVLYLRKILRDRYDEKTSRLPKIIYGGSVNEKNAKSFISDGKADGLLIGRASLDSKRFTKLVRSIA